MYSIGNHRTWGFPKHLLFATLLDAQQLAICFLWTFTSFDEFPRLCLCGRWSKYTYIRGTRNRKEFFSLCGDHSYLSSVLFFREFVQHQKSKANGSQAYVCPNQGMKIKSYMCLNLQGRIFLKKRVIQTQVLWSLACNRVYNRRQILVCSCYKFYSNRIIKSLSTLHSLQYFSWS